MRHPIVLITAAAILETCGILLFPQYSLAIILSVFIATAIFIILGFRKNSPAFMVAVSAILIFSALNPYLSYARHEMSAESFALSNAENENVEYVAKIYDSSTYSSSTRIYAKLISADGKKLPIQYKARLLTYERAYPDDGDIIIFTGVPIPLSQVENNGFNTKTYLRAQSVFIDFPVVTITDSAKGNSFSLLKFLRNYTKRTFYRHTDYDSENPGLCLAVFTGEKDELSERIERIFSECGLTHLICVSGLHLSIIAGFLYILLGVLCVPKKQKLITLIALCIFYTAFTGFAISTVRACIMCLTAFCGDFIGRKTNAFRSLFFSLVVIIMLSPYSVFDVSAMLSFSATLGIICTATILQAKETQKPFSRLLTGFASLFLAGLGASCFTLPLCAHYFGTISTVSVIATLLLSFVIELLLTTLMLLLLISPLCFIPIIDRLADSLGGICDFLCNTTIDVAKAFASLKFSSITPIFSNIFLYIFCGLIIILTIIISIGLKKICRIVALSIVCMSLTFIVTSLCYAIHDNGFYKVYYYRKNENDRQLSVKLGHDGYLLINADSNLCSDYDDLPFDYKRGKNHLVLIPDKNTSPYVLSENIKLFKKKYGIESISVPDTSDGLLLAKSLLEYDINCCTFSGKAELSDICVTLEADGKHLLSIDGKDAKTGILFSDNYDVKHLGEGYDICAYFTRKTKNQFDLENDTPPMCEVFITRLKKGEEAEGIINTFGQKRITIKG